MGRLFERRVENVARQFRGQTDEGRLFGSAEPIMVPVVLQAGRVKVDDPKGEHGERPDGCEIDVVTSGARPADCWA